MSKFTDYPQDQTPLDQEIQGLKAQMELMDTYFPGIDQTLGVVSSNPVVRRSGDRGQVVERVLCYKTRSSQEKITVRRAYHGRSTLLEHRYILL